MGNTKPRATIIHESPSLLRTWWMNKNLQYDVAMSSFIIIINIVAFVRVITYKIPFYNDENQLPLILVFVMFYILSGIVSCNLWVRAIEDVNSSQVALYVGRICHTLGFCIFFGLLYCISPHLALRFGVPGLIWFVAALVAPCCSSFPSIRSGLCQKVQELRYWWKRVNQPRSVVLKS
ncbi:unnamed protein product [Microthlaspi erraticum]|uniref:Uncharacterized protein n=1 Tax=Microthlaspi erraticum TaxID=1685480 RepID=A0A6D2KU40_9BRAS|nr:unnamed protein product [Microthlaspi erraticum]